MDLERGRADTDVRQRLSITHIYDLPFGQNRRYLTAASPWLNALFGGWRVAGIWTFQSGLGITPLLGTDSSNTGFSFDRPDVVAGQEVNFSAEARDPRRWFNTDAFARPPAFNFGNSGVTLIDGPGTILTDLLLAKDFPIHSISEDFKLEFRAEFFNAFNKTNFGIPNATFLSAAFGRIGSAAPARQIQFGLKVHF